MINHEFLVHHIFRQTQICILMHSVVMLDLLQLKGVFLLTSCRDHSHPSGRRLHSLDLWQTQQGPQQFVDSFIHG
jgi:hypothetical protein